MFSAKTCIYGGVAESVDALDSKSRSQYVSEGSSPSAPTLKETQVVSFLDLGFSKTCSFLKHSTNTDLNASNRYNLHFSEWYTYIPS